MEAWQRGSVPEAGTWLFFVRPSGDADVIVWCAAVTGGTASGEGTASGTVVAVDELRVTR